jgi:uncharacterized protein YlxP (DUF503 family)
MHIGVCKITLHLPANHSLKGKRKVIQSLSERIQHRFNVAIAEVDNKGSHCQYKHLIKKGKVTVPHPKKDFPIKTLKNILKQAGLTEKLKVHENALPYCYS